MNKTKYIYGSNHVDKYDVLNQIRSQFYNLPTTEYGEETFASCVLLIDGKQLDLKRWKLLELNHLIDFHAETKLSSKSILYQYVESYLMDVEFKPLVTTINALLADLSSEIFENASELIEEICVLPKFVEMTSKQLIKLIEVEIIQNELRSSIHDLNYNDLAVLQFKIMAEIAKKNPTKNYLILVDLPILPFELLNLLESHQINNLYALTNLYHSMPVEVKKVINIDKRVIDFADDIALYNEVLMLIECGIQFEDLNELLSDYIIGKRTDYVQKLIKIL
jgi:hypothetical protein